MCLILSDYRGISIIVPSIINYRPARDPDGRKDTETMTDYPIDVCTCVSLLLIFLCTSPLLQYTPSSTVTLLLTTLYNAFNQEKPGETVV